MKKLYTISTLVLGAVNAFAFTASTDASNPTALSSLSNTWTWNEGNTLGTNSSDYIAYNGSQGNDHYIGASTVVDCYLLVDNNYKLNFFITSGTGGPRNNVNIAFEDGTSLTILKEHLWSFNGDAYSHDLNLTLAEGATSAKIVMEHASDAKVDLKTKDALSVKSDGSQTVFGKIGRKVTLGEGITLDVTKSNFTISGRNQALTEYDSLFTLAGTINIQNSTSRLILHNTNFELAKTGKIVSDLGMQTNGSDIVLLGSVEKTTGEKARVTFNGGESNLTTGATNLASNTLAVFGKNTVLNIKNSMAVKELLMNTDGATNNVINIAEGATITVGAVGSNDTLGRFENKYGTIYVNKGSELKICSKGTSWNKSTTLLGNAVVDGGKITETNSVSSSFSLAVVEGKTATFKNGSLMDAGNSMICSQGGVIELDATSQLKATHLGFLYSHSTNGAFSFASTDNLVNKNMSIYVIDSSHGKISLAKDDQAYTFKNIISLRSNATFTFDLNGAELNIKNVRYFNGKTNDTAYTLDLIFKDFENGLVKIDDFNSVYDIKSGSFKLLEESGNISNTTCNLIAYDVKGNLLNGLWSVDTNGYLFNSALAIPEPAEWAMLLGAIALGFAVYRRRK